MVLHVLQRQAAFAVRAVIAALLTLSPGSARAGPPAVPAPKEDAEASRLRAELGRLIADAAAGFKETKGALNFKSGWGDKEYSVRLGLTGCSRQTVWREADGKFEFRCNLDPTRKELDAQLALAREQARAIVAALPAGWKAKATFRDAGQGNDVLVCHDPTGDLKLTLTILGWADGTLYTGLILTKWSSGCPDEEDPETSSASGSTPVTSLSGEPAGFYLGSLSQPGESRAVALELRVEDGALSGSYYYFRRTPRPLTLRGTLDARGAFRLEESGEDGKVTGLWTGTFTGGELRGSWKDPKKPRCWNFHLVRSERAPSWFFVGSPRSVETGSTGTLTYTMASIPMSRGTVPLLTSFRDPGVVSSINATLVGKAASAHCERGPDDVVFKAEVSFAGEGLLSVRIGVRWLCQGAHPNDGDRSLTFDLRTGRPIAKDELFRTDATPEEIAEVLFAYELSGSRRARGAPGPGGSRSREEECADSWTLKWLADHGFDSFHLDAEGLVVTPASPRVRSCANEVTVPYGALAPIVAPAGPLASLVATNAGKPLRYRIHAPETKPEDDLFFTPPKGK